jgi:hypothetical protein
VETIFLNCSCEHEKKNSLVTVSELLQLSLNKTKLIAMKEKDKEFNRYCIAVKSFFQLYLVLCLFLNYADSHCTQLVRLQSVYSVSGWLALKEGGISLVL